MSLSINFGGSLETGHASLAQRIEILVAHLQPEVLRERRHDERIPIPVLFRLVPLDSNRQPLEDQSVTIVGKNISRRGLSFYHEQPLPYRRARVELAHPAGAEFAAEIDITWCRFTRPGWYESGGRLIRAVTPRSESRQFDGSQSGAEEVRRAEPLVGGSSAAGCRF